MKKNQAVLKRVYKFRERRGLRIIDTKSRTYKIFTLLYILSFAWYFVIHLLYFGGQALVLADPMQSALVYMEQHYILCATTVLTVVGFVLMLCRQHLAGGILNMISLSVDSYQFYIMLVLRNKEFDSVTKFAWRHAVPAGMMMLFCLIMCAIALRAKHHLNRDYNKVLEALYINNKDKLHGGTEEEWEALLAELDDNALEKQLDKQHTAEYKKKKEAKAKKAKTELQEQQEEN